MGRQGRHPPGNRVNAVEIVEAPYLGVYVCDQVHILCVVRDFRLHHSKF
jgi:hypothetical protein